MLVATSEQSDIVRVVQITGTVTALRDAQLSVQTAGLVASLRVYEGDQVEKGDLLLELDASLALHQSDAAVAAQQRSQSALADAKRRLEEARRLAPLQSIAETVVKDLEAEVAEDEAALRETTAALRYRRGVLEHHRLRAPFAGVISDRSAELGEWVIPGQAVLSLVSTNELILDIQVPEDYLGKLELGARVDFSLGADKETRYLGRVEALVPVTDPTVRTFLVRVRPEAGFERMLPGMSALANLSLVTGEVGVTVPRDAILRYSDGRVVVWVVEQHDGQSVAAERVVQTGLSFGGRVEIRDGLEAGLPVVVKGNESLRNGQSLAVREPGA